VDATDILLAESLGWKPPLEKNPGSDLFKILDANTLADGIPVTEDIGAPCDFLGQEGCSFPHDLRPFRCTTFICNPMREILPPDEITKLEALTALLTREHRRLVDIIYACPEPKRPRRKGAKPSLKGK